MNLDKMTTKELRELRDRIDVTMDAAMKRARAELRERVEQMAREQGFSLDDVLGSKAKRTMKASATTWKDRRNGIVWAGRGRKPKGFDIAHAVKQPSGVTQHAR